jgi:hypothetical protein
MNTRTKFHFFTGFARMDPIFTGSGTKGSEECNPYDIFLTL